MENTITSSARPRGFRPTVTDWLFALIAAVGCGYAFYIYGSILDVYDGALLVASAAGIVALGWFWKPWRGFSILVALLSVIAVWLYQDDLARGQTAFWLKYMLSSQSAIMWMCTLFFLATLMYWLALASRSDNLARIGAGLTWSAAGMALVGLMVRWRESYLIGPDVGHIPVSNLYEVFVLFCAITALMYLYYESRFTARQMGAFVLPVISAAVGFILWYTFDRQAHEIQPLIPALQSWWMKIHVPANFIGYGAFSIAAMLGVAELWVLRVTRKGKTSRLPSAAILDEVMYKAIAVGFLFFTIATILGALWAAEAWGSYWSWDPKEVWALIVWLNYATWLHIRLVKGWRGAPLAWWAIAGLFVTAFAFVGVNMFLSGLHSYGSL